MRLFNTRDHYGWVAIVLHWLIAILLIGLLVLGFYMTALPISLQKLKLYGWHKEYGFLALFLAIIRMSWRLMNVIPHLSLPWFEVWAARAVHLTFYGFMFAMPVTGWLITSAAGLPASFFGLFVLPNLVAPNEEWRLLFQVIHQWIGYGLIVTIFLHASAAFKHHVINKDDILKRMIS